MDIIVLNEDNIKKYSAEKKHIVISIRTPGTSPVILPENENRIGCLYLAFPNLERYEPALKIPEEKYFNSEYAFSILMLVEAFNPELVICQCEAGISRSAGVAGALANIYKGDDSYFFRRYLPNMLVYKTILNTYHGVVNE